MLAAACGDYFGGKFESGMFWAGRRFNIGLFRDCIEKKILVSLDWTILNWVRTDICTFFSGDVCTFAVIKKK